MDSHPFPPSHFSYSHYLRYPPTPASHAIDAPAQLGGASYQWVSDYHRHPTAMHEALWRQMEKEKIREEIIAEEIARRRILEAEVRRELMLERELGMQITSDGAIYTSCLKSINVDPQGYPALALPQTIDRISLGELSGMSTLVRHEFGCLETSPQNIGNPRTLEPMPPSDTVKEKRKVILQAKTEAKSSGMKRKAEALSSVSVSDLTLAGDGSKKKVKEDFSCALCQVSSTSERGLKEHLQGKRHKAKEAKLRKNGKNFNIGLFKKKYEKTGVNIAESEKTMTVTPEANFETAETNNCQSIIRSPQSGQTVKKTKAPKCKTSPRQKLAANFKFWCEMCQVGAFAETVMETHRKGKKHLLRLLEQKTVDKPSTQMTLAKQENEKNLTEVAGEVVELSASRGSAPIINDVKLGGYQKEAGEDEDNIQAKGLGVVAAGVESKGNQTEAEFECDQKEESITDVDNSD